MSNETMLDESTWFRPTSDDFRRYFSECFGELLESHGFSEVFIRGQRWIRVVDDTVLQSVQFIPSHTMFYLFIGCQPLFFPVVFPKSRIGHQDLGQSFLDAEVIYRRTHQGLPYWGTPLYPTDREPALRFWRNVVSETVLGTLDSVTDLPTCHAFYQVNRSPLFSDTQLEFDGRYLLECVALHDDAECMQIRDSILVPLRNQHGAQYRVCFAPKWPKLKTDGVVTYGMLVSDLIEDLTGDRSILQSMMKKTDKQSRNLLKKAFACTGDGSKPLKKPPALG